ADDDDHEISGQVVGPMRRVVETADRAVVIDLQEGAKQLALAAAGAAAAKAALHCGPDVALLGVYGIPGPDWRRGAHGFHDLPLFDLPGLALPDLALADLDFSNLDFPNLDFPDLPTLSRGLR